MFSRYRFSHPHSGVRKEFTRWAYLFAAVFGALYVLFRMPSRVLHALALQIFCIGGFMCAAIYASMVPWRLQPAVVLIALIVAIVIQAFGTVEIMVHAYRLRGWNVRQD
jgi:hypothetical protein